MTRIALGLLLAPAFALAGPDDYQCVTKQSYTLDGAGMLEKSPPESLFIGRQFAVDRSTGRIVGGGDMDNGGPFSEVKVVDRGGVNQAFKIVTTKGRTAQLLVIGENRAGELKPFIFLDLTLVLTGMCR